MRKPDNSMLLVDDHKQDLPAGFLNKKQSTGFNLLSEIAEEDDQSSFSESIRNPGSSVEKSGHK